MADRLDAMRVRAATPDGAIEAELTGRSDVRFWFRPGFYERCTERDLERRLAGVASVLWARRMRAYYAALSEAYEQPITGEDPPGGPRDLHYREMRDELVARGRSADGRIAASVRGMRDWDIRIQDGTLRALDEHAFLTAAGVVAGELIRDQFTQIARLKNTVYG